MFFEILRFEFFYRMRTPAIYLYFLAAFGFSCLIFALGYLPLDENQLINSPGAITQYLVVMSMVMMLITSGVMGVPLYRDIENNTRGYYLSYPITEAGYFWGRYFGSILCVLLIALGILTGIYCGTRVGPLMGWSSLSSYGQNEVRNYLQPFLLFMVPNLFLSASIFFGLVAVFRSVRVIYSSGILLFLGYMIGSFFINASDSPYVIHLSDPFAVNGVRSILDGWHTDEKNELLIESSGLILMNRIIWFSVAIGILLLTWTTFRFEKFFRTTQSRLNLNEVTISNHIVSPTRIEFKREYSLSVMASLIKVELMNILKDNYFWIIVLAGGTFLGIIFTHGPGNFGVRDFPRTSLNLFLFSNHFMIFMFCVIIFYVGECVHRERTVGFAIISGSLPPASWLFHVTKIIAICLLCASLLLVPIVTNTIAQVVKGYYTFNFPLYPKVLLLCLLPRLWAVAMLAFALHILINNKFAAIAIGITTLVLGEFAYKSGHLNYNLLLYSRTPFFAISDFDHVGHMMVPVSWFNTYWILCGSLLLMIGYYLFTRGIERSLKEKLKIAKQRFINSIYLAAPLFITYCLVAVFNYYNVSYLNKYYTNDELEQHEASTEKQLKRYEHMPLPKIISIDVKADLFPKNQMASFESLVTLVNKTDQVIRQILFDGSKIHDYSIAFGQTSLSFSEPLKYRRPSFSLLGPEEIPSGHRLYSLPKDLMPGDTIQLVVKSTYRFDGFQNDLFGGNFLTNGTAMSLAIPGIGYDRDDEITNAAQRKTFGLSPRPETDSLTENANRLNQGASSDIFAFHAVISTTANQYAIAPGDLTRSWKKNGRNFFEYRSNPAGFYLLPGIISASFSEKHDSVIVQGRSIGITLYLHPSHVANLDTYISAYKDGLLYYSNNIGEYGFREARLAETTIYAPEALSMPGVDLIAERYGWNADMDAKGSINYCYYTAAKQLATQWWANQVAPNNVPGSELITEGISNYCALVLFQKKYGKSELKKLLDDQLDWYLWYKRWSISNQRPLMHAGHSSEYESKAGMILYGLKEMIGESNVNAALREFRDTYAYRNSPPFAGVADLYKILEKHVPENIHQYLSDGWEKICVYDNRLDSVHVQALSNSTYKIALSIYCSKLVTVSGAEKEEQLSNLPVDLTIKSHNASSYRKSVEVKSGWNKVEMILTERPAAIELDQNWKYLDVNRKDNEKPLE